MAGERSRGDVIPSKATNTRPDLESRRLADRLARVESHLNALPDRVLGASEIEKLYGPVSIRRDLQAGGRTPLLVSGLLGILSQPQLAASPSTPTLSTDPSLHQEGTLVTFSGVQYRYNSKTQKFEPVVASDGRIQVASVTTGSVAAGARVDVALSWPVAYVDASYVAIAVVLDTSASGVGLTVERLRALTAAGVTAQIFNASAGALTGTLLGLAFRP